MIKRITEQEFNYLISKHIEFLNKRKSNPKLESYGLNQVDYSKFDLSNKDFSYAHLYGSNFSYIEKHHMKNTNFSYSNLTYADFTNCDLSDCNLTGSILDSTKFKNTKIPKNLSKTQICNFDFFGKTFENYDLSYAIIKQIKLTSCKFYNCNFEGTQFIDCDFGPIDFKDCNLNKTEIIDSRFYIDIKNCSVIDSEIVNCNFMICDFKNNNIKDTLFSNNKVSFKKAIQFDN